MRAETQPRPYSKRDDSGGVADGMYAVPTMARDGLRRDVIYRVRCAQTYSPF